MNLQTSILFLVLSLLILQISADECQLSVSQTRRVGAGNSWISNPNVYQIYDFVFTNNGKKTILGAELSLGLSVGYPTQWWGLSKICCNQVASAITFNITIPYPLSPGQNLNAGFILQYPAQSQLIDPQFSNPIVPTEYHAWVQCQA